MVQLQELIQNTKKGSSSITEFCHAFNNLVDDLSSYHILR